MASLRQKRRDMRQAFILATVTVLSVAGAFARDLPDDVVRERHRLASQAEVLTTDSTQRSPINEIWVTADNQILVELALDESSHPNLFDLNGRTLVFTPDGRGGVLARSQGP